MVWLREQWSRPQNWLLPWNHTIRRHFCWKVITTDKKKRETYKLHMKSSVSSRRRFLWLQKEDRDLKCLISNNRKIYRGSSEESPWIRRWAKRRSFPVFWSDSRRLCWGPSAWKPFLCSSDARKTSSSGPCCSSCSFWANLARFSR